MATFHSRSNSFPSPSHPLMDGVEAHLCWLRASEATSTSATSTCMNLATLVDLHEGINGLIQMPSIQQALSHEQGESWINDLLEESLRLVDLCGVSRDVVCLTKESVQELESSIRRHRGETATADDINAYVASRTKIDKMVTKCIKNLKSSNQNSNDPKTIRTVLEKTAALDCSILKSLLMLVSRAKGRSKQRSWSLLSKLAQTSRAHSETAQECLLDIHKPRKGMHGISLKQLKTAEMSIQELEQGLEASSGV